MSDALEWDLGEYWERNLQSNLLECTYTFERSSGQPKQIADGTRTPEIPQIPNFIDGVWTSGQPLWLTDVKEVPGFCGANAAVLFPVVVGDCVVGVFAFLSTQNRQPDKSLLHQTESFGKQVGDFIQRKQSEKALYESEEQMRSILETTHVAIITIDRSGVIQSANPAALRMFQYDKDELLGQNVKLLMPQPYRDEHDSYISRYLEKRLPKIIGIGREVMGVRKDGTLFPVELAVSEIDHMSLFTGILRDISQRKDLEKEVLEISAQEQRRIGQELHDVTGQELTGLTLVAGTMVMLLDDKTKEMQTGGSIQTLGSSDLQQLRHLAVRLTQGLKDANLHVQQLSHGIMPVQVEPVGLRAALQDLAVTVGLHSNISCTCDISNSVEVADNTIATQLYRIAQEAVNNALRHSHAKRIDISLHLVDDEIVLEVVDDGIGIEAQNMPTKEKSERAGGFGLGIMNYRASNIGGTLKIVKNEPSGTRIRCTLRREYPCNSLEK
ncbi:MAG: PAS domain S-box protein [Pirellulaceae bacterium]|nr:PAS domain S-box protein [Pirellulaceae bacterium]